MEQEIARIEAKLDLLLQRLGLGPRGALIKRRVPCATPGCKRTSQTGDPRCWHCRNGRKP